MERRRPAGPRYPISLSARAVSGRQLLRFRLLLAELREAEQHDVVRLEVAGDGRMRVRLADVLGGPDVADGVVGFPCREMVLELAPVHRRLARVVAGVEDAHAEVAAFEVL